MINDPSSHLLDDQLHWYKDAIIYELHIKAFKDSNGDGIGDFRGLLEKLDYLQDLGVTAIWLLPFYPSPLRDDGYDIQDYYNVNPSYGKLKDFKKILKEADANFLACLWDHFGSEPFERGNLDAGRLNALFMREVKPHSQPFDATDYEAELIIDEAVARANFPEVFDR